MLCPWIIPQNLMYSFLLQQIMKDWSELWQKFIELTPLTPTAEPNSEVEYITHALVSMCTEKLTAPPDVYASTYSLMSDVLAILTDKLRYSELGKTPVRCKCMIIRNVKIIHTCVCVLLIGFVIFQSKYILCMLILQ